MKTLLDEIWLTFDELTSIGVTEKTIKMGVLRKSSIWQSIKDPEDKRKTLIRYATMSPKWKEEVKYSLCAGLEPWEWKEHKEQEKLYKEKLTKQDELSGILEMTCEKGYTKQMHLYPGYQDTQLKCLCRAAGIVEAVATWYLRKEIPFRDYGPAKLASEWINRHLEYFHFKYIPRASRQLLDKVKEFAVDQKALNEVIRVPRAGNENGARYKAAKWWQELAIYWTVDDRAYTQSQIFRKIRLVAGRDGRQCPSESTVRQLIAANEHITAEYNSDLNNKRLQRHRQKMPLARAMFSDDCWQMDGTQVQFMGHLTGKRTDNGRAEVKALYLVTVRDVYSGAYLGYWYGYAEREHAYRSALKMAVDMTGCLPYELRYDQFPGSNSANWKAIEGSKDEIGLLQKYGVKMTKTSKSSGKAHAERGFYTLQQVFESESRVYIGQGIKSSLPYARPTEKYIARTQREFLQNGWNFEQAVVEHMGIIATYNSTPMSNYSKKYAHLTQSPMFLYENGKDESGKKIEPLQIADLFWNARNVGIRQGCIEFTHKGKPYQYYVGPDEFDLLEYERKGVQLTVRHDPFDLSCIMVFNKDGVFLAELKYQEKIQTFGKYADFEASAQWKQGQKAISEKKKRKLSEYALSDETAALLPLSVDKATHNDALTRYAEQHARDWREPEPSVKKGKIQTLGQLSDSDIEDLFLNQI
jgi:hypothetical protein